MPHAAIVLAGGRSSRLGRDKASLPFGGETLVERVVSRLLRAVPRVVVAVAPEQRLPALPKGCAIARDAAAHEGPLHGLAAGLRMLDDPAARIFLAAVDLPFLAPALVEAMLARASDRAAAVPRVNARPQPLAAAYPASVLSRIDLLTARGERSMQSLLAGLDVEWVEEPDLERVDPGLRSFFNLNTPEDYARALAIEAEERRRSDPG